jgi:hydrogenase maturation protease
VTEPVLVIGYGNDLRRDDGAGPAVARALARCRDPRIVAKAVHQLTPELSQELAIAKAVVFVDAAQSKKSVCCRTVAEDVARSPRGHTGDPAWLLGLTAAAFGCRPPSWFVGVPAEDFAFGFGLSARAARGVREAVATVQQLLDDSFSI